MHKLEIKIHEVATDGLPNMKELVGRVAYIWNGAVISGWPIGSEFSGIQYGQQRWEPSEDRHGGPVVGVTHWIEFPVEAWKLYEAIEETPDEGHRFLMARDGQALIYCAVCLEQNEGQALQAVTIKDGTALCAEHQGRVSPSRFLMALFRNN